jgi:hypothetical protein
MLLQDMACLPLQKSGAKEEVVQNQLAPTVALFQAFKVLGLAKTSASTGLAKLACGTACSALSTWHKLAAGGEFSDAARCRSSVRPRNGNLGNYWSLRASESSVIHDELKRTNRWRAVNCEVSWRTSEDQLQTNPTAEGPRSGCLSFMSSSRRS